MATPTAIVINVVRGVPLFERERGGPSPKRGTCCKPLLGASPSLDVRHLSTYQMERTAARAQTLTMKKISTRSKVSTSMGRVARLPPLAIFADGTLDYYNELDRSADCVRDFWEAGQASLKEHPVFPVGPNPLKANAVITLNKTRVAGIRWSKETLRVARKFAERCSRPELERLLKEARDKGYRVGYVILTTLFEAPAPQRKKLWKQCLAAQWSKSELESARRRLCGNLGTVPGACRTVATPATLDEAKDLLRLAAESFARVCDAVARPDQETRLKLKAMSPRMRQQAREDLAGKDGSHLSRMTAAQRKVVAEVLVVVKKLAKAMSRI